MGVTKIGDNGVGIHEINKAKAHRVLNKKRLLLFLALIAVGMAVIIGYTERPTSEVDAVMTDSLIANEATAIDSAEAVSANDSTKVDTTTKK